MSAAPHPSAPCCADPSAALATLVSQLALGDPGAVRRLFEEFAPMIRSIARCFGLSSDDAEDLVQDTMVITLAGSAR